MFCFFACGHWSMCADPFEKSEISYDFYHCLLIHHCSEAVWQFTRIVRDSLSQSAPLQETAIAFTAKLLSFPPYHCHILQSFQDLYHWFPVLSSQCISLDTTKALTCKIQKANFVSHDSALVCCSPCCSGELPVHKVIFLEGSQGHRFHCLFEFNGISLWRIFSLLLKWESSWTCFADSFLIPALKCSLYKKPFKLDAI